MPFQLTALQAVERIQSGLLSSRELVASCLDQITASDENIGAWAWLNPEQALAQADALDEIRQKGLPLGSLHGIPVGIKDIFDTVDMPTEHGTTIHKGRQPDEDCAVICKLREAGAVIMGKTVTTEFAFLNPANTSNPHDPARTPGGSSSGSAAAVAAGHVPLAIGSQTNGSTIRPASFCGIYGFKPTYGIISRHGVLETSKTLDQVGVFARSLEDVALLTDILGGYDPRDCASYSTPRPNCLAGVRHDPPAEPNLVWYDLSFDDLLDDAARQGLNEVMDALGVRIERFPAPGSFADIIQYHQVIHEYEIARCLSDEIESHWDGISNLLQPVLKRGQGRSKSQYEDAIAMVSAAKAYFGEVFNDVDAILTPSSAGQAPLKTDGTGNPIFCTIWTFCGLPCLSLPLLTSAGGLPTGVQLVGSAQGDDRLLRTARWMEQKLLQDNDAAKALEQIREPAI